MVLDACIELGNKSLIMFFYLLACTRSVTGDERVKMPVQQGVRNAHKSVHRRIIGFATTNDDCSGASVPVAAHPLATAAPTRLGIFVSYP